MKKLLIYGLVFFGFMVSAWSQEGKSEQIDFENINKERVDSLKDNMLVPNNTFNKIIKSDFSKVQTVTPVSNVANKYAALDLNKEKQTFSFSPFVLEMNQHNFGVNFSGSLNNKGYFNFEDRNQVEIGLNYTFFFARKSFDNTHRAELERLYDSIKQKVEKEVGKRKVKDISIESDSAEKMTEKKYEELLSEYEVAFAEKYWKSKHTYWVTLNFTPFNQDNFRYIRENDTESYLNPYKESLNVLKMSVSLNYYYENKNWIFSPSLNLEGSNKHSLSEIYSTKQWNKIVPLTDETYLSEESENVYVLTDENFSRLFLLDVGLKLTSIYKKINLGIDVSYNQTKFITPGTSNSVSKIDEFSFGFVFPFVDSEGKRTINIVPFYSYKQFIDFKAESDNIFGVKFNIPLGG